MLPYAALLERCSRLRGLPRPVLIHDERFPDTGLI
jgi:hypothetical protein